MLCGFAKLEMFLEAPNFQKQNLICFWKFHLARGCFIANRFRFPNVFHSPHDFTVEVHNNMFVGYWLKCP